MEHIAIYNTFKNQTNVAKQLTNKINQKWFPELVGKKGLVFSLLEIQSYLKKEANHDDFTLTQHLVDGNGKVRKLASFSSGQQKQLLLKHLKQKLQNNKETFLVVDNPYDCMDVNAQIEFAAAFEALSKKNQIVQIFKIREEVFPFVQKFCCINEHGVLFSGTEKEYNLHFQKLLKPIVFSEKLPLQTNNVTVKNPLVKFTDVHMFYEETRQIVKNIHWEIKKGEFWHLKGPNGSGKTSLLTMITGDNPKAYGQNLTLFGQKKGSGESVWELKKKIGYFSPNLTDNFNKLCTVQQMLLSGFYDSVGLYQKPTSIQIQQTNQWLELLGLLDKKQKYFTQLSLELQRVVLIARAMVKCPPLLILDEPANELNDASISRIGALIGKIHQETNVAILYVSHRILPGLEPDKIFELIPTSNGSIGKIRK